MTEADIKNSIRLALCQRGCKVFNRPTGTFYSKNGSPIKFNQEGHSDLQGHRPDGKVFYIETKKADHRTDKKRLEKQMNFIDAMKASGALAGFAQSVEEALEICGISEGSKQK